MTGTSHVLPPAENIIERVDPVLSAAVILKDYLNRSPSPPESLQSVSVTKLLNPGQAYYDVVSPIAEELDAFQKRMAGTGAHDSIEKLLGLPAEQTLDGKDVPGEPSLDGIRGKLDAYLPLPDGSYVPVEIKNVRSASSRPSASHLEQIGMYCAMLSSDHGLLVRIQRNDATGQSIMLSPLNLTFPDLGLIKNEMARRRDLILDAVARRDPSGLPSCAYASATSFNCKYRAAGVCNCKDRAEFDPVIAKGVRWEEAPEFLSLVAKHVEDIQAKRSGTTLPERFSPFQLLIPRKLYFDATRGVLEEEKEEEKRVPGGLKEAVTQVNKKGLETQLFLAIKRANKERVSQAIALAPPLKGTSLSAIDGVPFQVKVRMVRNPIRPTASELSGEWGAPDDLRRLAIQATFLSTDRARLYVWNWKVADSSLKLQVFDLKFRKEALVAVEEYERAFPEELKRALASGDHRSLPLCPRWMCKTCEFHEKCRPDDTAPATAPDDLIRKV